MSLYNDAQTGQWSADDELERLGINPTQRVTAEDTLRGQANAATYQRELDAGLAEQQAIDNQSADKPWLVRIDDDPNKRVDIFGSAVESVGITANAAAGLVTGVVDLGLMGVDAARAALGDPDMTWSEVGNDADNPLTRERVKFFKTRSKTGDVVGNILNVGAILVSLATPAGWAKAAAAAKGGIIAGASKGKPLATGIGKVATMFRAKSTAMSKVGVLRYADDATPAVTKNALKGLDEGLASIGNAQRTNIASILEGARKTKNMKIVGPFQDWARGTTAVISSFAKAPIQQKMRSVANLVVADFFATFLAAGKGDGQMDDTWVPELIESTVSPDGPFGFLHGVGSMLVTSELDAALTRKAKIGMEDTLTGLVLAPLVDGIRLARMATQFKKVPKDIQEQILKRLESDEFNDFADYLFKRQSIEYDDLARRTRDVDDIIMGRTNRPDVPADEDALDLATEARRTEEMGQRLKRDTQLRDKGQRARGRIDEKMAESREELREELRVQQLEGTRADLKRIVNQRAPGQSSTGKFAYGSKASEDQIVAATKARIMRPIAELQERFAKADFEEVERVKAWYAERQQYYEEVFEDYTYSKQVFFAPPYEMYGGGVYSESGEWIPFRPRNTVPGTQYNPTFDQVRADPNREFGRAYGAMVGERSVPSTAPDQAPRPDWGEPEANWNEIDRSISGQRVAPQGQSPLGGAAITDRDALIRNLRSGGYLTPGEPNVAPRPGFTTENPLDDIRDQVARDQPPPGTPPPDQPPAPEPEWEGQGPGTRRPPDQEPAPEPRWDKEPGAAAKASAERMRGMPPEPEWRVPGPGFKRDIAATPKDITDAVVRAYDGFLNAPELMRDPAEVEKFTEELFGATLSLLPRTRVGLSRYVLDYPADLNSNGLVNGVQAELYNFIYGIALNEEWASINDRFVIAVDFTRAAQLDSSQSMLDLAKAGDRVARQGTVPPQPARQATEEVTQPQARGGTPEASTAPTQAAAAQIPEPENTTKPPPLWATTDLTEQNTKVLDNSPGPIPSPDPEAVANVEKARIDVASAKNKTDNMTETVEEIQAVQEPDIDAPMPPTFTIKVGKSKGDFFTSPGKGIPSQWDQIQNAMPEKSEFATAKGRDYLRAGRTQTYGDWKIVVQNLREKANQLRNAADGITERINKRQFENEDARRAMNDKRNAYNAEARSLDKTAKKLDDRLKQEFPRVNQEDFTRTTADKVADDYTEGPNKVCGT